MIKLPEWAKYVARDEDGCVFAFENKPYKDEDEDEWLKAAGEHCQLPDASYPHVKWEDEQPLYLGVKNEEQGFTYFYGFEPSINFCKRMERCGGMTEEENLLVRIKFIVDMYSSGVTSAEGALEQILDSVDELELEED